jgi:hypothetical protein
MLRAMALTTVTGRVGGALRLKAGGDAPARVVASSWASDRPFPRTRGAAVSFELEAGDGAVYRVDPFEALVALPVRATAVRDGVRREEAWIALADEIVVEGELERAGRAPALRARRITVPRQGAAVHRLPPRALERAEAERIPAAPAAPEPAAGAPAGERAASEPSEPAPAAPRRPKKRRPDPNGTPPPAAPNGTPPPAAAE